MRALLIVVAAVWLAHPLEWQLASRDRVAGVRTIRTGSLAALGGFKAMAAGACWLRTNLAWERRDREATLTFLRLTVAADGRPLHFWLNGARMIAYDFPTWVPEQAPAALRRQLARDAAERALGFLEEGAPGHPARAEFFVEMANIRLRAMGDREEAARLFRRAAEQPGAPWHAARIHAELLREMGRPAEALAWLRQILPTLPAGDPAACRTVVEQRIRELESLVAGR